MMGRRIFGMPGERPAEATALRARGLPGAVAFLNPLLRSRYQDLTRKHLDRVFEKLIAEYTGLHYHIAWAPAALHQWDTKKLPTGGSLCCRRARPKLAVQPICRRCGSRQLGRALRANSAGLSFECRLGVLNYWLPLRVRGLIVGIAYLQALNARKVPEESERRQARSAPGLLTRPDFRRAGRLLRLVVEHLQTLDVADLRKSELTDAGRAVVALEREQARLHETLKRHLPSSAAVSHRSVSATRGQTVVEQLLEWIGSRYEQPITLQACARELRMNAAYLSNLFSQAVGVPFKTYLTEVRISKAKQLLGDLNQTVSEVAHAVGYNSENRFRVSFKEATGLSPRTWRTTLRARSVA